ncbi:hypothetical protein MUP79_04755, partial [Candidatus Bathyarchaeota archaeon]|nr:hypothetical protein [Candidatus Bathyarchaeota archaeon]
LHVQLKEMNLFGARQRGKRFSGVLVISPEHPHFLWLFVSCYTIRRQRQPFTQRFLASFAKEWDGKRNKHKSQQNLIRK